VALREREIRIRQFSDACVNDAANIALRDRVQAATNDELRVDEAHVRVRLRDGRVLERHVDHQLGSIERPMSDSELVAKLHDLADPMLGAARVAELARACWEIERLTDASTLVRLCVPG
jgi:2-methylcitrate dehydratase PrpD